MVVNIHEAKTQLSQLLKRIALGETVTIARDGTPVAQLVPIEAEHAARLPDMGAASIWMAVDWDSPQVNAQAAALFAGEPPDSKRAARAKAQ